MREIALPIGGMLILGLGFWLAMYIPWQLIAVVMAVLFVTSLTHELRLRRNARRASPSQTASSLRH